MEAKERARRLAATSVQAATRGLLARLQAKWVAEQAKQAEQAEESERGLSPRAQSGGRLAPRVSLSPARSHLVQPSSVASAAANLSPRDRHKPETERQSDGPLFSSFFGNLWGATTSASASASASTSKLWAEMEAEEVKLQAELEAAEPELTNPDLTKQEASRAGRGGSSELGPRRWSSKEIDPSEIAEIETYSDNGDDNGGGGGGGDGGGGGGDGGGGDGGGGGGSGGDSKPRAKEEHAPSKHAGRPSPGLGPSSSPSNQRNGGSSTSSESKLRARRAEGAVKKAAARKEAARAAGSEQSEATPHPGESTIGERTVTRDEPHPAEGAMAQIEAMDAAHAVRRVEDERARNTYAAQARLGILNLTLPLTLPLPLPLTLPLTLTLTLTLTRRGSRS